MNAWKAWRFLRTPMGVMRIEEDERGIVSLRFADGGAEPETPPPAGRYLADAERQLSEYFAGSRKVFDLPLSLSGSAFQRRVWNALRDIPYGETRSYQEIAAAIGDPRAARAVGMANSRNPLLILLPCHRVIGKSGRLTGYAGGVDRKRYLLEMEERCGSASNKLRL